MLLAVDAIVYLIIVIAVIVLLAAVVEPVIVASEVVEDDQFNHDIFPLIYYVRPYFKQHLQTTTSAYIICMTVVVV